MMSKAGGSVKSYSVADPKAKVQSDREKFRVLGTKVRFEKNV